MLQSWFPEECARLLAKPGDFSTATLRVKFRLAGVSGTRRKTLRLELQAGCRIVYGSRSATARREQTHTIVFMPDGSSRF